MSFSQLPISCYIRTLNEERMIGEVITAAKKICSEVIIIDSLSIDKTKSISLSLGASVYEQPWLGNGFQKRVGEDKSKNKWVLDIDADEIVTDEMSKEIIEIFKNGSENFDGFLTPIITVPPFGKPWHNFARAHRVKLYNKTKIRIPKHKAWDQFKLDNLKIKKLKNGLLHPSFTGIHMHLDKLNKYSTMLANLPSQKSYPEIILRIWLGIPLYFIHKYFFRGMFRAGTYGFALSFSSAIGRWLKDVKQYEKLMTNRKK
tara:strand:+ start:306 stop:1082 length:777 start_codon:yes stop_codon:yes gene_type:complete